MKKILFITLLIVTVSCKKEEKRSIAKKEKPMAEDVYKKFYGNWVGDFNVTEADSMAYETEFMRTNKINLVIKKMEPNGRVYGQSIVAGNSRPLEGVFNRSNAGFSFTMSEPGDKKDDGKFIFTLSGDSIYGNWVVNNKKSRVWEREYKLGKQPFKYNPKLMLPDEQEYVDWFSMKVDSSEYEVEPGVTDMEYSEVYRVASDVITKINASTTLLTESELKNLKKLELEIIRNTIFARHGYTFKKKSFRQFFDPVSWYIPVTDDMSGKLTAIEQKNIVLLNRFQKYAEDNYDSFGR